MRTIFLSVCLIGVCFGQDPKPMPVWVPAPAVAPAPDVAAKPPVPVRILEPAYVSDWDRDMLKAQVKSAVDANVDVEAIKAMAKVNVDVDAIKAAAKASAEAWAVQAADAAVWNTKLDIDIARRDFDWAGKGPMIAWASKGPKFDFEFAQKDRASSNADREYDRGTRSLDERKWDEAANHFNEAAATGTSRSDGALYWKAYALSKLGRNSDALAALDTLAKTYPQSRWLSDANALKVEVSQASGKPVSPDAAADDEMKLMAINSLVNTDPERAIPLLEKLLTSNSSPKLRERALFVLSQNNSPKAHEVVARIAKGGGNPDLQMKAVQSLGVYGGKENRQLLSDVYTSSNDVAVKKQVLKSYMISGERDRLLALAKSEPNQELRGEAINYLGVMGANTQLAEMYASETAPEIRERIMKAMFVSGNSTKLIEIAKTEKDPKIRNRAIQYLGTMGRNPGAAEALVSIYGSSTDVEAKSAVLRALFVQGSAKELVEIARKEPNIELKQAAVRNLSNMKNKEATDYLVDLLK